MQKEISIFFEEIEVLLEAELPFVIYRKPNSTEVHAQVQNDQKLRVLTDFDKTGFVFAPFHKAVPKILFPTSECNRFFTEITNGEYLDIHEQRSNLTSVSNLEATKGKHLKLVTEAIDYIKNGDAKKIVLSWKEQLKVENLDLLNTFKKMLTYYENAFVYLWVHPKVGLWMGASPERLLHIKENYLKSMALAGTQLFKGSVDVEWNDKEIREQEIVADFVLEQLKGSISSIEVSKPYTTRAGNLLHIRTDISGKLNSDRAFENLINSLHPTPAVCGLPKDVAANYILDNEGYDRNFYSGYLGELNMNQCTNLYVNLRCMKIQDNEASIYVGGGITRDSNAENEWNETLSKTAVMRKVL